MYKNDIVIIGGGIVGLATAWRLKKNNPALKITIIEKENGPSHHQTGHNSGVIHSGIYYKPGSLKAINCLKGYSMLIQFAQEHNIPFDLCGKIIVATRAEQIKYMDEVYQKGILNGLSGLKKISAEEIREIEPYCAGISGIWVPQTGIIDYTKVSEKLASLFENDGGKIIYNSEVSKIIPTQDGLFADVVAQDVTYTTRLVINCAGLFSDRIALLNEPKLKIRIIPFRGEYYKLKPEKEFLVKNLIYPVPDPNFPFLGVHFTRMISGGIEAGPNAVLAFKREGYHLTDFNLKDVWETLSWPGFRKVMLKYWLTGIGEMYRSISKAAFAKALQQLVPEISTQDLIIGGAGVRAQACEHDGGLLDDFSIIEKPYIIHVLNAPSPAATSSLSIGETIAQMALARFN